MHKTNLYVPKGVNDRLQKAVKNHLAEEFGGYTVIEAKGAWKNPQNGNVVKENVQILEVLGMDENKAKNTAQWIQEKSSESEVLYTHQELNGAFE